MLPKSFFLDFFDPIEGVPRADKPTSMPGPCNNRSMRAEDRGEPTTINRKLRHTTIIAKRKGKCIILENTPENRQ